MDVYFEKLAERIQSVIDKNKDKIAYSIGDRQVTYARMDEMARHIASGVARMAGDKPVGDIPFRIGISLGRDEDFIPCILAALKLGCSYVPIDVKTPADRRDFISEDASLNVLISKDNLQELLSSPLMETLPQLSGPVSEAYIIYTSGTTGKPKGVSVPFKALYSFLQTVSRTDNYHVGENSVILQFASISFDISVLEIFSALFYGGTLVVAQEEHKQDVMLLHQFMIEKGITFTLLPPSLLAVFPDFNFPAMDTLAVGGESVPQSLTSRIVEGNYPYRYVIGYGPTETCVGVTALEVTSADQWQNIGKPVPGVVCYVADEQGKLVAPGGQGELLIGGMQMGNGYWNRPDLTARMFFDNPYEKEHDGIDVSRLYHSGDLVILNEDGSFNYVGRKDSQVKLHSFRIELGEICSSIEKQEGVQRAVVRLEEIGTEKYLVAYVLATESVQSLESIRQDVSKVLPSYMVPTFWNRVKEFKLNINGKIDQSALVNEALNPVITNDTPVSPYEELLMQAAAGLIGLPSINVNADLINDVGITSLHIMQLIVQMGISGFNLTPNDFYTWRSIRKIMAADKHPNAFWYKPSMKDSDKPVIIVISGYTSFSFLFDDWARKVSQKYDIFAIESYHTVTEDKLMDMKDLIDIYVTYVEEVVKTRDVEVITGFCAGGEQALALAARLYNGKEHKPRVVVLDGELDREIELQELLRPVLFFPFYNDERNNRRADLDIHLMATQPEETYDGPVTSIVSTIYTEDSAVNQGYVKPEDVKQREKAEFFTNEQRWKNRYPDCEIIPHPTNHNQFLVTRESKDILVDYFLNVL